MCGAHDLPERTLGAGDTLVSGPGRTATGLPDCSCMLRSLIGPACAVFRGLDTARRQSMLCAHREANPRFQERHPFVPERQGPAVGGAWTLPALFSPGHGSFRRVPSECGPGPGPLPLLFLLRQLCRGGKASGAVWSVWLLLWMDVLCEEDIVPLSTLREIAVGLLQLDISSPCTVAS